MIIQDEISYIRDLQGSRNNLYKIMEELAKEKHIPIITPEVGCFLQLICQLNKPQNILEVGTAIGYSTMWLHDSSDAEIDTIEKDVERWEYAVNFFGNNFKNTRINFYQGDALELLGKMQGKVYDLIFLDAAKGQYNKFFDLIEPLTKKGTIMITDNIFLSGKILAGAEVKRRKRTMVNNMNQYNKMLAANPNWTSHFFTIGDGIVISIRN